jgi:hypothetical protein
MQARCKHCESRWRASCKHCGYRAESLIPDPGIPKPEEAAKPARASRKPDADAPPLTLTVSDLISEGVKEQHAREWLKVRTKHKADLTVSAWEQHKRECLKAGITPGQGVQICATVPWRGFDHTYSWRKYLPADEVAAAPVQSKFGGCDAVEPA